MEGSGEEYFGCEDSVLGALDQVHIDLVQVVLHECLLLRARVHRLREGVSCGVATTAEYFAHIDACLL